MRMLFYVFWGRAGNQNVTLCYFGKELAIRMLFNVFGGRSRQVECYFIFLGEGAGRASGRKWWRFNR